MEKQTNPPQIVETIQRNDEQSGFVYFDSFPSLLEWTAVGKQQSSRNKLENFNWNCFSPRTLVCHDHRGGYLDYESLSGIKCADDKLIVVPGNGNVDGEKQSMPIPYYNFFHWWYIDIFVYFSHHFVTVPPPVWISQAHKHGILILGTFITEAEGIFKEIFSSEENVEELIVRLVDLCKTHNFDGWLINIENKVDHDNLERMENFLEKLRKELRKNVHNCTQLIWYDSVTETGELKWQNELNKKNSRWFYVVDGFYTNYCWKEEHIQRTLATLFDTNGKSPFDVYVGIDVFGRGCPGGGGWNCIEPLEIIRRYGLSAAIFAPGWTCERFPELGQQKCLYENSLQFWHALRRHLFPHKLTSRTPIRTNFAVGFSSECHRQSADDVEEEARFCMANASLQPFYLASSNAPHLRKDLRPGLIIEGGGVHDIFLCHIPLRQCDRGLEFSFTSSAPMGLIIAIARGEDHEMVHFHYFANADSEEEDPLKNDTTLESKEEGNEGGGGKEGTTASAMLEENATKISPPPCVADCQHHRGWLPFGPANNLSGWHIRKISFWTRPNSAQNLRVFHFEMDLK